MTILKAGLIAGCTVFAALQMIPVPMPVNAAVKPEKTLEASLTVPPHVTKILDKSCKDCHSSQTRWPWYAKVAPGSWLMARDVEKARKAVNFSEWTESAGKRKGTAMGALIAACEGAKAGRMPPPQYLLLHPEAKPDADEVRSLCEWTTDAMKELRKPRS